MKEEESIEKEDEEKEDDEKNLEDQFNLNDFEEAETSEEDYDFLAKMDMSNSPSIVPQDIGSDRENSSENDRRGFGLSDAGSIHLDEKENDSGLLGNRDGSTGRDGKDGEDGHGILDEQNEPDEQSVKNLDDLMGRLKGDEGDTQQLAEYLSGQSGGKSANPVKGIDYRGGGDELADKGQIPSDNAISEEHSDTGEIHPIGKRDGVPSGLADSSGTKVKVGEELNVEGEKELDDEPEVAKEQGPISKEIHHEPKSKTDIMRDMLAKGMSPEEIAAEVGGKKKGVFQSLGPEIRERAKEYFVKGMKQPEIAQALNMSDQNLYSWINKYDDLREVRNNKMRRHFADDKTLADIEELMGVGRGTVSNALKSEVEQIVEEMLADERYTIQDVADRLGRSKDTVHRIIDDLDYYKRKPPISIDLDRMDEETKLEFIENNLNADKIIELTGKTKQSIFQDPDIQMAFKSNAVELLTDGMPKQGIANEFSVSRQAIYRWIGKAELEVCKFLASNISVKEIAPGLRTEGFELGTDDIEKFIDVADLHERMDSILQGDNESMCTNLERDESRIVDLSKTIAGPQFVKADWRAIVDHLKEEKQLSLRDISREISSGIGSQLYQKTAMELDKFEKLKNLVDPDFKFERTVFDYDRHREFILTKDRDTAEMIGVILGDGHLNGLKTVFTLNRVDEKEFVEYVTELAKETLNYKPTFYIPKDEEEKKINVVICSAGISSALEDLGLTKGNKVANQVGVPEWIKEDTEFTKACVKGLFDSDGSAFFDDKKDAKIKYIDVNFTNASKPLLNFFHKFCIDNGIKSSIRYDLDKSRDYVSMTSRKSVTRFAEIIQSEKISNFLNKHNLTFEDLGRGIRY